MTLIDSITVQQPHKTASIQLLQGDLSAIPPEQKVDGMVVSAFPNNYKTLPGSLVLALDEKGLSLKELAENKLEDLREQVGCWFSNPISESLQEKLNFRQILCFEPGTNSDDAIEVVGNIFRCLNNFVYDENVTRIALPVIATGYQKVPFEKMFPVLIDTAIFWLKQGLPLDCIKIVIRKDEYIESATSFFKQAASNLNEPEGSPAPLEVNSGAAISAPTVQSPANISREQENYNEAKELPVINPGLQSIDETGIDYFISYAHTQTPLIQHFVDVLMKLKPALKIFYDKTSISAGGLWIREISDAITRAGKVLIFMSPDYSASMVCWDEFQCAKLKEYNDKASVIQTIYLTTDPKLPPIMGIHSYIDCREGNLLKLATACEQLLAS
jgi:hypothetical protein